MPTLQDLQIANQTIVNDNVPINKKRAQHQKDKLEQDVERLRQPRAIKAETDKQKCGRKQWVYDEVIGKQIAEQLATTDMPIRKILASSADYPSDKTYYRWRAETPEFEKLIRLAYRQRVEIYVDQIIPIADDQTIEINDRKLMIDARKWMIDRTLGKLYTEDGVDAKTTEELVLTMRELVSKYRREY